MDDFARRYLQVLALVAVLAGGWWILARDSIAGDINAMLDQDAQLAGYPYAFRVVSVDEGIASVSSPRSASVSVIAFLRAAFPDLAGAAVDDPEMLAAQERLVAMQSRAAELVEAHPEVDSVRWQLDETWYARRGVYIDSGS